MTDMEVSTILVCECNGRSYPNGVALKQHHKTNIHRVWDQEKQIKDLGIRATRLENENMQLRNTIEVMKKRLVEVEQKPKEKKGRNIIKRLLNKKD